MKPTACYVMALALLALPGFARADARSDYFQRAAASDTAAFHSLDVNHDGVVSHDEIIGDNDFGPRFNDIDRNRDGVVTQPELALYIRDRYGIDNPSASQATMTTWHTAQATPPK